MNFEGDVILLCFLCLVGGESLVFGSGESFALGCGLGLLGNPVGDRICVGGVGVVSLLRGPWSKESLGFGGDVALRSRPFLRESPDLGGVGILLCCPSSEEPLGFGGVGALLY